jgi:PAS domain S-box-containing protein
MQTLIDILDRVSDAFVALDKNWCYTYVNQQAASLFGRRPEDLVGRHIWTEFPEGRGQPCHLAYEKAMADQVFI